MQKTFSLENMETYFNNYISCNEHKKQPITNFCTENPCLKFLCPECIEAHSSIHSNHNIQSIKTCIKKTSEKLRQTIFKLENQIGRNSFLKGDNTEEYTKKLMRELQQVKQGLIAEIKAYFKQKQYDIKKQTSRFVEIQKKLESLKKDIVQATSELKMLDRNLYIPQETVKAITKANKLNFIGMVTHFHSRIDQVDKEMNFNIHLEMNNEKRGHLRSNLNELIGIKNSNQVQYKNKNIIKKNPKNEEFEKYKRISTSMPSEHIINPPPLSADRMLQQSSFRIEQNNYFQSNPFLHFFEVTNSTLHLVSIDGIKESSDVAWEVVPLEIDFKIPSFHRTIATENGNIFIIGGTHTQSQRKSKSIYSYDPKKQTLNYVANLVIPRSSHSVLCHKKMIYISGGMTDSDQTLKKCEVFNPNTGEVKLIASCKYPTTNSTFCSIGNDQLIKLGGVFANGQNNDSIQVYNIRADHWGEVDPTIQNMNGQFGLLSCSGWAPLNESQVFIFGGYNEEADSQNSRMSFVLENKKQGNEFFIKYLNQKNPPLAEGFWNQQGIVHNGLIYCLQNVDGEQGNDCLEDKRNILIFNGKTWSSCFEHHD